MAPKVHRRLRPAPRPAALSRRTVAGFDTSIFLRDFLSTNDPNLPYNFLISPKLVPKTNTLMKQRFLMFSPSSKLTKTSKEHELRINIPSSRDCSKIPEFPSLGTQPIHHNYSIQIDPKEFPKLFQQFALLTFDFC